MPTPSDIEELINDVESEAREDALSYEWGYRSHAADLRKAKQELLKAVTFRPLSETPDDGERVLIQFADGKVEIANHFGGKFYDPHDGGQWVARICGWMLVPTMDLWELAPEPKFAPDDHLEADYEDRVSGWD
jgi:hypothetical protein